MFRSLSARLVATYLLILILAVSGQSMMLVQLLGRDYIEQRKQDLVADTQVLASLTPTYLQEGRESEYFKLLSPYSKKNDAVVWYVNQFGVILQITSNETASDFSQAQDQLSSQEIQSYLSRVLGGTPMVYEHGFSSRFAQAMLSVGHPVTLEGQVVGAVFIHTGMSFLSQITRNLQKVALFVSCFTMAIGKQLIYWTSSTLTRPIKRMNRAARNIAKGSYGDKIPVRGRDEIAQLTESFNLMSQNLERNDKLRSGFVANVSHELRSPLTSMQGFAQGMLDGTIPEEERGKYLHIIVDESRRLNKLIHELLDLSMLDAGSFPLHKTDFDVNELIRRIIIRYIDKLEDNGIELDLDFRQEYCYVTADADRIQQVLVNLIDNAIRYTPEGGTLRIWTHTSEDRVHVSIADSGSGISPDDLPYIFERFYKADHAHSDKSGTGLGLSIVKSIIDQHGQDIHVQSQLGKGTAFVFTLERGQAPRRGERQLEAGDDGGQTQRPTGSQAEGADDGERPGEAADSGLKAGSGAPAEQPDGGQAERQDGSQAAQGPASPNAATGAYPEPEQGRGAGQADGPDGDARQNEPGRG